MSGDVQPRKRKDKKKKKDELVVEEPRGTAAALGEGDVFMHSYHDHGTGGHWCAKIIFFSLLAILLTLIGLIILENRGLSELEANAVESRYSGVLDGWLEDAPNDDHHDAHTLELNHPVHSFKETNSKDEMAEEDHNKEEAESNEEELDSENGDEHDENDDDDNELSKEEEDDDDDNELSEEDDNDDDELQESQEENEELDNEQESVEEMGFYRRYFGGESTKEDKEVIQDPEENTNDGENYSEEPDDQEDDENDKDAEDGDESNEYYEENNDDDGDDEEKELNDGEEENNIFKTNNEEELNEAKENGDIQENEDDDEHDDEDDDQEKVEHIEKEVSEEEPLSLDLPVLPEADDDKEDSIEGDDDGSPEEDNEDEDFLEQDTDDDDDDEPIVERITAPAGKPFVEIDEDDLDSTQKSPDTLEEEEEYERKQEELRREEEEQGSNIWLKLSIGGALLAATQAVVRRAATPRDALDADDEENEEREETPVTEDRRMTLIPEDKPPVTKKIVQEISQPVQEQTTKIPFIIKSAPTPKQASLEDEEVKDEIKQTKDKELYSDDEDLKEEEEVVKPAKKVTIQSAAPKQSSPEPESDEEVPDDVEIIDEEQIEEELAEEDDEEEISDVDDAELLTRLEAKYGRLPEPERFGPKPKGGGKSVANQWPGEPSDPHWRQELDTAEDELIQGAWSRALERASKPQLSSSGRARWVSARALDLMAEAKRDNALLTRAINAYVHLLKMNEGLSDKRLIEVSSKALERIKFRGNYMSAEPVYRMLIRRFPQEPVYRNNLTISFLMAGRSDLAERVLKETLELWPEDRVALAHYGFILKTEHKRYEEAIDLFEKALEGDSGPANEPRFYYHLGDSLLLLGRFKEAHEVHKRGAALGHFLSPAQRSLYNVERLKSRPWWDVSSSPHSKLARALEKSWREILKEGEAARALFEKETEGLKERGDWTQMDLFVRGREIPGRCKQAPITCSIIKTESGGCSRGQVKFSSMVPGTHVRPHVGPTNCRLRMHLGLSNTKDTFIRVDQETRQWQLGKVLMFDDSFEHEVWHNGTGTRLVLIVDVWHPDLTPAERRNLPPI